MRVALYLRQSQDRDGNAYGVDRQRDDVERLVTARGWEVVETYVDNDVSATSRKPRPAFERMMEAVDRGQVDVIAARHMDRLLRRLAELEAVMERCQAAGVHIVTASDGVDTSTDGGRLVARILASVGQGEVERKAARQKSATAQAAAQGRRVGGRRPFGYEADGITIREAEAAVVRAGYESVLAGESLAAIARAWNSTGIPTPQARRDGSPSSWTAQNARDVLTNPRYAGLRRHRPSGYNLQARQDPEAFITGPAVWPGVVPEETWRAAVRVLTDPSRRKKAMNGRALLTGLARCSVCGATVHTGGATHEYRAYRCRAGGHVQRRAQPVEDYVRAVVVGRLSMPDALETFAPSVAVDVAGLRAEADTLRRRLDDAAADYADGILTRAQLATVTERIRDRLAEVDNEVAAAGSSDLVAPLVAAEDVTAAFDALPVGRKRATIDALMEVTLKPPGRGVRIFNPDDVVITWKGAEA